MAKKQSFGDKSKKKSVVEDSMMVKMVWMSPTNKTGSLGFRERMVRVPKDQPLEKAMDAFLQTV